VGGVVFGELGFGVTAGGNGKYGQSGQSQDRSNSFVRSIWPDICHLFFIKVS
jgi:hypothetical protein